MFEARQGFKHLTDRFVVSFLAGGETGFVNAVVHIVVNPAVQFVDFIAQFRRIKITGPCTVRIKRSIEHTDDLSGFITDDGLVFLVPQNRHSDASGVVRVGAQVKLIEEIVVIQFIASGGREVAVEGPAVFQHQRIDDGNGN
ncbi:hypothetical protein D3C76_1242180 [compost metagenome]